jgi:carbon-monoxide dehydrogenase medium subunit
MAAPGMGSDRGLIVYHRGHRGDNSGPASVTIPRFAHVRPTSVDGALAAYAATDEEGTYYAGGTELLQIMKAGFAAFSTLVDLKGIAELRTISTDADGWLRIGGAVTHREIERSAVVAAHVPALPRLIHGVANVRVRNTGTLGGNLAFAEPHSDPAAFLLACGAEVELAGPDGRRRLSIDELVLGPLVTDREPGEIITAIRVPPARAGEGRSYRKIAFFERPAAAVAVRLTIADGTIHDALVTLGSVSDVPMAVPVVGRSLIGAAARADAVAEAARAAAAGFDEVDAAGDHNGSADFKRHLAGELLVDAVVDATEEALAHD